jgi:hypothetical protein
MKILFFYNKTLRRKLPTNNYFVLLFWRNKQTNEIMLDLECLEQIVIIVGLESYFYYNKNQIFFFLNKQIMLRRKFDFWLA